MFSAGPSSWWASCLNRVNKKTLRPKSWTPVHDIQKWCVIGRKQWSPVYMRPGRSQSEVNPKFSCFITSRPVRKSQIFHLFPLALPAIFYSAFVRACIVPKPRAQPRPIWNGFMFTFIPLRIQSGLKIVGSIQRQRADDFRPIWAIFRPGIR
jgi:hypothetical protein